MVEKSVCPKGKLADNESRKISDNYAFLLDELDSNLLRPLLYQKRVINHEEMENLKSESLKSKRNGNECFLKYVLESGKGGFDKFVECLKEGGYTEAVSRLKSSTEKTEEIRGVLVGKTGVGKSALGNSLLGEKVFLSKRANSSVTLTCSDVKEGKMTFGEKVKAFKLLDTPGLVDTRGDKINLSKLIASCVFKTAPGPHVFIYVINLMQRFTEEDGQAIDDLKNIFGDKVMKHLVVVFTGKDGLEDDNQTMEDWLVDAPPKLKEILDIGYVAFSNKTYDKESIGKITQMIDKNVQKNDNKCYSNDMYKEAVKLFEKAKRVAEEESRTKENELMQINGILNDKLSEKDEELEKLTAANNKVQSLESQVTELGLELKTMVDKDNNAQRGDEENERNREKEWKKQLEEVRNKTNAENAEKLNAAENRIRSLEQDAEQEQKFKAMNEKMVIPLGHIKCQKCKYAIAVSSNITEQFGDPPLRSSYVSMFGKMVKKKLYTNPGGYFFDIFTSTHADVIEEEDMKRSIQHTWFPGYDWTLVRCPGGDCREHIGWLFQKDGEKPFYAMIIDRLTA